MPKYRVYQVDSFTTKKLTGNPAGVVANADGLDDFQMQAIARELNNSETAFLLSPISDSHDVWVRFFTPSMEVPICGHATIAAHFARALEMNLSDCQVLQKTGAGILPVDIIKQKNAYKIVMTQGSLEITREVSDEIRNAILGAIGLTGDDLDRQCPIQIVSTGHSKVIIGVKEKRVLNSISPDLSKLAAVSHRIGSMGYFVFTLDSDIRGVFSHGRMFAPALGIPEDPVTGNANGPLGAYLVHNGIIQPQGGTVIFRAKQGEAMGRPGIVEVTVDCLEGKPIRVKVAGEAVIAFTTELEI